ncbi:pyridoxamine 5'-phosphate oxidase [Streptomyces sp. T1317-0309]|nr:pyridoxamine 5'-phosphate oxidase [Streptomyces sp. T1317-0309]
MDDFLIPGALTSEAQLRELYADPGERAVRKELDHIDEMSRRLIAVSPVVFVATSDAMAAVTWPLGAALRFRQVLDERHVVIPDATGNNRLDSYRNILANGHAGLNFVIPGRDDASCQRRSLDHGRWGLLARLTPVGKPPKTALVVRADEVYVHCAKAFVRSKVWRPEAWPLKEEQPTPAEVALAHQRDPT